MIAAVGLIPQAAGAQQVVKKEKPLGFHFGDLVFHPFFEFDSHYVYNPGRIQTPNPVGLAPTSDLHFAGRPGFALELPGETLELKLDADVDWDQYAGIEGVNRLTGWNANTKLDTTFNKSGSFIVKVGDEFTRASNPGNQSLGSPLKHIMNDAGLNLDAKPGGGAMVFTLGFDFLYDYYDRVGVGSSNATQAPELLDNMRFLPRLKALWKFLPKTALFLDAQLTYTLYPNQTSASSPGATGNPDSFILATNLGANGNITSRMSAVLKAGFGYSIQNDPNTNFPVIGMAEVNYDFSELAKFGIGYKRSVQPSPEYIWTSADFGYLRYQHILFGTVQLNLDAGVSYLDYGPPQNTAAAGTREDILVTSNLTVDFFITEWLAVSLINKLEFRNRTLSVSGSDGTFNDDVAIRIAVRY